MLPKQLLDFLRDAVGAVVVPAGEQLVVEVFGVRLETNNANLVCNLRQRGLRQLAQINWEIGVTVSWIVVWAIIHVVALPDVDVDLEVRREHVHASQLLAAAVEGLDHAHGLRHAVVLILIKGARLLRVFHF